MTPWLRTDSATSIPKLKPLKENILRKVYCRLDGFPILHPSEKLQVHVEENHGNPSQCIKTWTCSSNWENSKNAQANIYLYSDLLHWQVSLDFQLYIFPGHTKRVIVYNAFFAASRQEGSISHIFTEGRGPHISLP